MSRADPDARSQRRPLVIAHRGASGYLPENTLPAYERAVAQNADMIEIDLHRTCDGAIVVAHDADLTGLGGRGEIADVTLSEVRTLDAGGGECVPTLDEVLEHALVSTLVPIEWVEDDDDVEKVSDKSGDADHEGVVTH